MNNASSKIDDRKHIFQRGTTKASVNGHLLDSDLSFII